MQCLSCLSSLCLALAELRREEGREVVEGGGVGLGEGRGLVGGGEEELREGFNLHMVDWPRKTGQEFATFRLYSQTIHALLMIGHGHRNKENIDVGGD